MLLRQPARGTPSSGPAAAEAHAERASTLHVEDAVAAELVVTRGGGANGVADTATARTAASTVSSAVTRHASAMISYVDVASLSTKRR